MHVSVEDSLKKLRTDYIDILYVHWWDYTTTIEELMNSLHHLVAQRKVLYLGISDTPSYIVTKANMYARLTGKTPFVIYEGEYNIMARDVERDILPMVREEGDCPSFFITLFISDDVVRNGFLSLECSLWRQNPQRCG